MYYTKKISYALVLCAFCAPLFAQAVEPAQTLDFYKSQGGLKGLSRRDDKLFSRALATNVNTWIKQYPDHESAKQAYLLEADYLIRAGENAPALLNLFKVRFFYPNAEDVAYLTKHIERLVDDLDKKKKPEALRMLAMNTEGMSMAQKEASLLNALVKTNFRDTYPYTVEAFEDFFVKYPDFEENDKMELLYGDLHRHNGNYQAAIVQYKKVSELYPDTPFKAASMRMTGDVYADNLRNYESALSIYTNVLKQFPESNEVGVVYKHMAIMEENRKNYNDALVDYNKAIEMLEGRPTAYEAWRGKADVYAKMKEYEAAYKTLEETAELFQEDESKYVDTLLAAAEMAGKRLKNPQKRSLSLEKIMLRYPKTQQAPHILFELGYTYEKSDRAAQAMDTYKNLIVSYPTDGYAKRGQDRLDRLEKKAAK